MNTGHTSGTSLARPTVRVCVALSLLASSLLSPTARSEDFDPDAEPEKNEIYSEPDEQGASEAHASPAADPRPFPARLDALAGLGAAASLAGWRLLLTEVEGTDTATERDRFLEWVAFVQRNVPQWCAGPKSPYYLFTRPAHPDYPPGEREARDFPYLNSKNGVFTYLSGASKNLITMQDNGPPLDVGQLDSSECSHDGNAMILAFVRSFSAWTMVTQVAARGDHLVLPRVDVDSIDVDALNAEGGSTSFPLELPDWTGKVDLGDGKLNISGPGIDTSIVLDSVFGGANNPDIGLFLTPRGVLVVVQDYSCHYPGDGNSFDTHYIPLPVRSAYPPFFLSCGVKPQLIILPSAVAADPRFHALFATSAKNLVFESGTDGLVLEPGLLDANVQKHWAEIHAQIRQDNFRGARKPLVQLEKSLSHNRFFAPTESWSSLAAEAISCYETAARNEKERKLEIARKKSAVPHVGAACKKAIERWPRVEDAIKTATLRGRPKDVDKSVEEQERLRVTICNSARELETVLEYYRAEQNQTAVNAITREHSLCLRVCPKSAR